MSARARLSTFPITLCGLLLLSLILAAAGCKRDGGTTPEPKAVIATTYALADIARQVGGERVRVEWWVESGQSLKLLAGTPERSNQFRLADIVVTRGSADPWTLEGTGNVYQDRRLLRVDSLAAAREVDPQHYFWLDPQVALELADDLATRLSHFEPRSEAYFKDNRDRFRRDVGAAIARASEEIYKYDGVPFVTLDKGFLPLARRFGMTEVQVPMVALTEPTTYNVKTLRDAAKKAGAGAVFASTEAPAALLRDWQDRLGMPVLPLEPLGTSAGTGRSSYLDILRYNLDQLSRGVALAAPREPRGPVSLGAVQPADRPDFLKPLDSSADPDAAAAATRPATAPTSRKPSTSAPNFNLPTTVPANPFSRDSLRLPMPATRPKDNSPFKPIPSR